MLLKFEIQNYRSFRDCITLSLRPAWNSPILSYSIQTETTRNGICRALPSAVLYGPNAAGKSSLIEAMDTMRSIVLRGHIRDEGEPDPYNPAAVRLSLIPFAWGAPQPVQMGVAFIHQGMRIGYAFTMDLGGFQQREYPRRILSETISVDGEQIFSRGETLSLDGICSIRSLLNDPNLRPGGVRKYAENSLLPTELFLPHGFRCLCSAKLAEIVREWFAERWMVYPRVGETRELRRFLPTREDWDTLLTVQREALQAFGGIRNRVRLWRRVGNGEILPCSSLGKEDDVPAEQFESAGTMRFLQVFSAVLRALQTGSVLVLDDFDASLHPMAVVNLIQAFHSADINIHGAQLIFNTHNPLYLREDLFRQDEIHFADRDEETRASTLSTLSDFDGDQAQDPGGWGAYAMPYLQGRYGAVRDVDFSDLLEKLITAQGAEKNNS